MEGIVPGGGIASAWSSRSVLSVLTLKDGLSKEEMLAAKVLGCTALEAPFHQIVTNAGIKARRRA